MGSSSVRTPKLQLSAEQPSREECWIPPKIDTPHIRAKEQPQQDGRQVKLVFKIKPHTPQRHSEDSTKPYAHHEPEAPKRLNQTCL